MSKNILIATATGITLIFLGTMVLAQGRSNSRGLFDRLIRVRLVAQDGSNAAAGVTVVEDRKGPDQLRFNARGLKPRTRYTVFMAQSSTVGALPVQFLGEFTTDKRGRGQLNLTTEIIDAFATANQTLENNLGIADVRGAGALSNGANTIPLNYIRVYLGVASPGGLQSVFGTSDNKPGGGLVMSTTRALP